MDAGGGDDSVIADMNTMLVTISDLKAEMLRLLEEDRDVKCFMATRMDAEKLAKAIYEFEESLGAVIGKAKSDVLPEVESRLSDYPKLLEQLKSAELIHQAMSVINDIQYHMSALQTGIKNGELFQCLDEVVVLDSLFKMDIQLAKEDIEVIGILRNLYISAKHSLLGAFLKLWNETVVVKEAPDADNQIVCSLVVNNLGDAPKLVRAFEVFKLFHSKVDAQLCDTLLEKFFRPAVSRANRVLECSKLNDELHLVLIDTGEEAAGPPDPVALSQSLQPVLATLHDCLLGLPLDETGSSSLIDRLRPRMEERLHECLLRECLGQAVPTSASALANYGRTVGEAIGQLERTLIDCGFVSKELARLGQFVQGIGRVFADKRVELLLAEGRRIALMPLGDTAPVGGDAATTTTTTTTTSPTAADDDSDSLAEKYIGAGVFDFPACRVSQSCQRLLEFLERIRQEASASDPPELLVRIAACYRQLLLMYRDAAAARHANELAEVPHLSALYYNSCQYLAHQCTRLEFNCVAKLLEMAASAPAAEQLPLKPPKSLVDVACALREEGARVFVQQLTRQRQQLLEPVAGLRVNEEAGSLECNDRLCRQALFIVETLGRVWRVLPAKVHRKSLGSLCHSLLQALIAFALAQEDFSSRDADDLARLFSNVRQSIARVFTELPESPDRRPGETLDRYIPSWNRFVYLGKMLESALAAFPDLWCDGKSPLASAFTDTEVKSLIKALFMNTEDRAYVLAKIK